MSPRGAALAVALVAVAAAVPAWSFVRTTTCRTGTLPTDPLACEDGEDPIPIFWDSRCVVYHIARSGLPTTEDPEAVYAAIRESFETWDIVGCSYVSLVDGGFTNEDRVGYNSCNPSENANIIIFRDANWRHARGALALTSVTYDMRRGEIVDADIELNNTNGIGFTTSDIVTQVNIDVKNTVTHEAGHLLGLDHTPVEEATMFATAPRGEIRKRDLHQDDISGLCAIYPDGDEGGLSCDLSAVGFFERPEDGPGTVCSNDGTGCACAASGGTGGGLGWLAFAGAALGWVVVRKRRG